MSEMTMVERVALAISGSDDPASVLAIHRDRARLAIAEMRAIPYGLLAVGRDVAYNRERELRACGYDTEMRTETLRAQWEAIIDAALRGSPGEPQEQGGA